MIYGRNAHLCTAVIQCPMLLSTLQKKHQQIKLNPNIGLFRRENKKFFYSKRRSREVFCDLCPAHAIQCKLHAQLQVLLQMTPFYLEPEPSRTKIFSRSLIHPERKLILIMAL